MDWRKKSVRKPLTVFVTLFIAVATIICLLFRMDMPTNISGLLQWLGGITIGAYFLSSSTEAILESPRSTDATVGDKAVGECDKPVESKQGGRP